MDGLLVPSYVQLNEEEGVSDLRGLNFYCKLKPYVVCL
jgi:hypothetical protein